MHKDSAIVMPFANLSELINAIPLAIPSNPYSSICPNFRMPTLLFHQEAVGIPNLSQALTSSFLNSSDIATFFGVFISVRNRIAPTAISIGMYLKNRVTIQNPYCRTISALPAKAAVNASNTLTSCLRPVLRKDITSR